MLIKRTASQTAVIGAMVFVSFGAAAALPCRAGAAETVAASGSPSSKWSSLHEPEAGLSLKYPAGWKVTNHPDKDTLVKIEGTIDGIGSAISLTLNDDPTMTPVTLSKTVEMLFFPKLQNYKKVQQKTIAFGPSGKLQGEMEEISFQMGGLTLMQRWVFFSHGGHTLALTFTAPASEFNKLAPISNDVLVSIQSGAGSASSAAAATARASTTMSHFRSAGIPLRFSYPADWSVENREDPDHPLEISGKDGAGNPASISFFTNTFDQRLSLDQVAESVDEKYLKIKPAYREIRSQSMSFGSSAKLDGIMREATFQEHGMPARQYAIYFRDKDHIQVITFTSIGWSASASTDLFHKLLATIQTE